jgi:hypothetical protein
MNGLKELPHIHALVVVAPALCADFEPQARHYTKRNGQKSDLHFSD